MPLSSALYGCPWGPFGASWEARGDVATSSLSAERPRVVCLYHEPVPASRGGGGSACKVPYGAVVLCTLPATTTEHGQEGVNPL